MARYAIVQDSDNLIINAIEWDGVVQWDLATGYHSVLDAANEAIIGGTHDGANFVPPVIPPFLSADGSNPHVWASDNVDTGTVVITDSRGAAANGKTVKIKIPGGGNAGIDSDAYVLSGAGQATVSFLATNQFTGELIFEAYYDSGEAGSVKFVVRRGTA